jgi:hypothetical protein
MHGLWTKTHTVVTRNALEDCLYSPKGMPLFAWEIYIKTYVDDRDKIACINEPNAGNNRRDCGYIVHNGP